MRQGSKGNSPEVITVITLFQGVVDEVRLFQPQSEELEEYRADWLARFGHPSWRAYRQDLKNGMPKAEFWEFGVPMPDGQGFVIVNHAHPMGKTLLKENCRGCDRSWSAAWADAAYAAQEYGGSTERSTELTPRARRSQRPPPSAPGGACGL